MSGEADGVDGGGGATSDGPPAGRERLLADWVDQPPTVPIVQYLRDAEREAALSALGERDHVLDIASESTVTDHLEADRVTRIDFSGAASDAARGVLGAAVDEYLVSRPGQPDLELPDDAVDGAISVGPYDWRFLDVDGLTGEVGRVLRPSGRFVFTVPTPRSPYAAGARNRFRYYEPREAFDVVSPGWRLADCRPVYQLPTWPHRVVSALPGALQRLAVAYCRRATSGLDDVDGASYLVVGAEPAGYDGRLRAAVEALFRPAAAAGFWDDDRGTFLRAQRYGLPGDVASGDGAGLEWRPERRTEGRYGPFALMGAMKWRASPYGTDEWDDRLRSALSHYADRVASRADDGIPSYGLGPLVAAFALADRVYGDWLDVGRDLAAATRERVAFRDSEDVLLLYGWSHLADRLEDPALDRAIDDAAWRIVDRQDPETGLFAFENSTDRRHQNQMYACWALSKAVEYSGADGYLENVERVLDYTVDERMRDDGAFRWDDVGFLREHGTEAFYDLTDRRGVPHWQLLFSCHQTFFVNAVAHYRRAGGERSYDRRVRRAMAWIDGTNPRGVDLVDASGLGVPLRFTTTDGRIDVPEQRFKGSYEVGSYVMALVNLLEWGGYTDS